MKKIFFIILTIFISSCAQKWNYEQQEKWGKIKDEYKFCNIGYNQSPINVKYNFADSDLQFFYQDSDVEKKSLNYVLRSEFFTREYITRGKKKYFTRYFEFHHPSEHLVNGEAHSLEMQIAHKSEDEQWLIVTIFLEVTKENNPKFDSLIKFLQNKKKEGKINLSKIVKEDDKIFYYDGSFTTPPCREGVKWYVMKTPILISKDQMNAIIKSAIFVKSNARKIQEFHPERY